MKKLLIATALAFMSLSAAAEAKPVGDMYLPSLDVFYGDLNLSNPSGARVVLKRIKFAASRVCGGEPDTMLDLVGRRQYKHCVGIATKDGVSQLKSPLVTAVYTGRTAADMRVALGDQ